MDTLPIPHVFMGLSTCCQYKRAELHVHLEDVDVECEQVIHHMLAAKVHWKNGAQWRGVVTTHSSSEEQSPNIPLD